MAANLDEARGKKGNLQKTLSVGLSYVKYSRLMFLLFAMALAIGLVYFVFARSVYYSRSLVDYKLVGIPVHSESNDGGITPSYLKSRSLLNQLNSRYLARMCADATNSSSATT